MKTKQYSEMEAELAAAKAAVDKLQPKHFTWMAIEVVEAYRQQVEKIELEIVRASCFNRETESLHRQLEEARNIAEAAEALRVLFMTLSVRGVKIQIPEDIK